MSDNPQLPQNFIVPDATLRDLLEVFKKDIMLSFNCHAIATVQVFDEENQTITATMNYKKTFFERNPITKIYNPVLVDYPVLVDMPAIILQGGGFRLTFPIARGDQCLVLFNDRDLNNWFESNQVGAVASPRLHSFSDGIALVGLYSLQNSLDDYDTDRAVLGDGEVDGAKIAVATGIASLEKGMTKIEVSDLISIHNATLNLSVILQTLLAGLASNLSAISPGAAAACTTAATQLAGLLE